MYKRQVLNKERQEIDLKQTFDDDEEVSMVTVDEEAFSSVTNESDLEGYAVEEPEEEEEFLSEEESFDDMEPELLLDDEI